MGKLEKSFYLLCFFLVIFIVAGFKVVPAVLKEQLIKNLDENLTTKTTIEKIEFNPFTLNWCMWSTTPASSTHGGA